MRNLRVFPALLAFSLLLAASAPAPAGERVAIVIGNGDYPYPERGRLGDLRTTVADALVMHELLKASGFRMAEPVINATRIVMEDRLIAFKDSLNPGDEAVIYYAGHGIQHQNKVWLMGTNAELLIKGKLDQEGISDDTLTSLLGERRPKIAVVMLDCCREVPSQSWLASDNTTRGLRGTEAVNLNPPPNILMGYATSSERLANDNLSKDDVNGPLVSSLRRHWDKGLEFDRLWKVVAEDVYTQSLAAAQAEPDPDNRPEVQMPSKYGQTTLDFFFSRGAVKVSESAVMLNEAEIRRRAEALAAELAARMIAEKTPAIPAAPQSVPAGVMTPPAFPATPVAPPPPVKRGSVLDSGKIGDGYSFDLSGGAKLTIRHIPGGEFLMGSPAREKIRLASEDQVRVTLSSHYWMGETEVTQAQWESVMGSNPSGFKGANLPVENVSWEEVKEYVRKLNEKGGPAAGWKWALPSEAQWERACRGGTETAFSFGDSLSSTQANLNGNYPYGNGKEGPYLEKTTPVKSYGANAYGLYDMHGNVGEWCEDWYGEKLSGGTDPTGAKTGSDRVLRGGSWGGSSGGCRSALRYGLTPVYRDDYLGFRLAAVPEEQR